MSTVDATVRQPVFMQSDLGREVRSGEPVYTSPGKRIAGRLVEMVLTWFTLWIGWAIWSLIVWKDGLTPAKQLLDLRVINVKTGERAGWWRMALREVVAKPIAAIAGVFTLGVLFFMPFWDDKNQALWDKIAGTVVVDG